MAIRPFTALLHATALSIMAYGYTSLNSTIMGEFIQGQKGGHFQFLTIWGLAAAWLTTLLSLGADFFPSSKALPYFKRSFLMVSLALAVIISSIYWTLIAFLPNLILPPLSSPSAPPPGSNTPSSSDSAKPALAYVPLPVDLALHAVPALTLLLDFFLLERKFNGAETGRTALTLCSILGAAYAGWVEWLNTFNHSFPYPFLNVPFPVRLTIYSVVTALSYASFRGINALHRGQPLLINVESVQKVIDPKRGD